MAARAQAGPSFNQPMQRVIVSYSAPTAILSSVKWQQVQAALNAQLPLRNIHWKPASRNAIRTIQELDVVFMPLDSLRDEHTQVPVTLLEKPLLNIYVVVWPNNDVEGYRNTVKKQIKDWHSVITAKKNQEWLILHIVRPDKRLQGGNFFQLSSVFEKIRTDFNTERKERCIQVAWSSETDTPTIWAEFFNKIKDGVLSAFDSAVLQREDEVRRSESQRQMPGWNFCTFFILKESLAASFEGINLFEDAYALYEELETSFYHVVKVSWFGNLINPVSGDDSSPLLSASKKVYRELIIANTISVFDFRIYLLSRECELLAQLGRINEICRKAEAFLGAFGRRLRDAEGTLPPHFIESWIYSSALSVVEYCDSLSSKPTIAGQNLDSFHAVKGELLELARNQLDVIGVDVGYLPSKPPFYRTYHPSPQPPNLDQTSGSLKTISNQDILAALDDVNSFYELYVSATNRAISRYTKAGRKKFALRLHESLAALDLHRGRLATALTTYASLPAHYASHTWTSLESYVLSRALDTHAEARKDKDTEWIHILLSYLKAYVDTSGSEVLTHEEDKVVYITRLVEDLGLAATKLEADLTHPDHPAVSIHVSQNASIAETTDGSFLDATVRNYLPCPIRADKISVVLAGRDSERYRFTSSAQALCHGETQLTLFCPATAMGTYVLDSSELRMGQLCLQWTHWKPLSKAHHLQKHKPLLVRVPKDLLALDVQLSRPSRVELGEPTTLLIAVSTGRNDILRASVKVASSGVIFRLQDAYFSEDKEKSKPVEIVEDNIVLKDVPKDTVTSIQVPHSDTSAFQAMKILTDVEYVTALEPDILRTICITRIVLTALPISVNVEDFFRGTRLFSKFTISTTSHQHVRICATELNSNGGSLDGVRIVPCTTKNRRVVTVTPAQTASFLFYIESAHGPVRESLSLLIRYRMLREEVESVVENVVVKILEGSPSHYHRVTLISKLVEALEHDATWVELYGITGELKVPRTPKDDYEGEEGKLLGAAKQLLAEHRHPHPPIGPWREIKIPVDVPYMDIVAAVRLQILATPFSDITSTREALPLYAGQPISAVLVMHTSFRWGSSAAKKDRRYVLRYDMEEMVRDWLVSGPKRDNFVATDDATHTVPITLIALHHGELALPKVAITPLPVAGEMAMGAMAIPSIEVYQVHGAEKVLVLPRGGRSTFVVDMGPS